MKCNICNNEMKLVAKNEKYSFYKCKSCVLYASCGENEFNYENYETFDAEDEKYSSFVEQAIKMLRYKFDVLGYVPKSFLDVGCSEGVWVEAFSNISEGRSCGIEVSEQKVKRGKNKGLEIGNYDEIEGKFDFIYLRHVIEHINEPKDFLDYIAEKYLSEDGVICIETPNNKNIRNIIYGNRILNDRFFRELYPPTHVVGFTLKSFKKLHNFVPVILQTTAHNDSNWYFDVESDKEHPVLSYMLSKLGINTNLFAVLKRR